MTENELSKTIVDLCIKVHKKLGPGLLESAYEECLIYELKKQGLKAERQVSIPLIYDGVELGELQRVNFSQLLTYLRLTGLKLGLLINFGENRVIDGIHRIVNSL